MQEQRELNRFWAINTLEKHEIPCVSECSLRSIQIGILLCSGMHLVLAIHVNSWLCYHEIGSAVIHRRGESCQKQPNEHLSWWTSRIEYHEVGVVEGNSDSYAIRGTHNVGIRNAEYLKSIAL